MGYFKNKCIDDSPEVESKTVNLGSFFRWLLDEHPEDDEIFELVRGQIPEWDELSADDIISQLMKDNVEGQWGVFSSDMAHLLPPGYWDRLRELFAEFLEMKNAPEEVSVKERKVNLQMVKTLPDGTRTEREWNFREDNNQHFYGDIPCNQEIITLTLNWKPDSFSPAKLVGKYQIDLPLLLEKGFVQDGSKGIRLRFQSTGNAIEIAIDRNCPALRIGSKPE